MEINSFVSFYYFEKGQYLDHTLARENSESGVYHTIIKKK